MAPLFASFLAVDVVPPELLGPSALLVAALIAVAVLWRDHQRSDKRTEAQNDLLLKAVDGIGDTLNAQNDIIKDALRGRARRAPRE